MKQNESGVLTVFVPKRQMGWSSVIASDRDHSQYSMQNPSLIPNRNVNVNTTNSPNKSHNKHRVMNNRQMLYLPFAYNEQTSPTSHLTNRITHSSSSKQLKGTTLNQSEKNCSFSPTGRHNLTNRSEMIDSSPQESFKMKQRKKTQVKKPLSTSASSLSPNRMKSKEFKSQLLSTKVSSPAKYKEASSPQPSRSKVAELIQASYKQQSQSKDCLSNNSKTLEGPKAIFINTSRVFYNNSPKLEQSHTNSSQIFTPIKTAPISIQSNSIKAIPVKSFQSNGKQLSSLSTRSSFFDSKQQTKEIIIRPASSEINFKSKPRTRSPIISSTNRSSPQIITSPKRITAQSPLAVETLHQARRIKLSAPFSNPEVITKSQQQNKKELAKYPGINKRNEEVKRIVPIISDQQTTYASRNRFPSEVNHPQKLQLLFRSKLEVNSHQQKKRNEFSKVLILHFNNLLGFISNEFFEKSAISPIQSQCNLDESNHYQSTFSNQYEEVCSGLFVQYNLVGMLEQLNQCHYLIIILPKLNSQWKSKKKSLVNHFSSCCSAIYSIATVPELPIHFPQNKSHFMKSMLRFSSPRSKQVSTSTSPKSWVNQPTIDPQIQFKQTNNSLVQLPNNSFKDGPSQKNKSLESTQNLQLNTFKKPTSFQSQSLTRFKQPCSEELNEGNEDIKDKLFIDYSSIYEDLRIEEDLNSFIILESITELKVESSGNKDLSNPLDIFTKTVSVVDKNSWKQFLGKFPILSEPKSKEIDVKIILVLLESNRFQLPNPEQLFQFIIGDSESSDNSLSQLQDIESFEISSYQDSIYSENFNNCSNNSDCIQPKMEKINILNVIEQMKKEKEIQEISEEKQNNHRTSQMINSKIASDYSTECQMKANILKQLLSGKQAAPMFKGILEHLTLQKEPEKQGIEIARRMAAHSLSFLTDSLIGRNFRNQRQQLHCSGLFDNHEVSSVVQGNQSQFLNENQKNSFIEQWTKDIPFTTNFLNSFFLCSINP